jgi:mono/diheme cytochrome c family protein
MDPMRAAWVLLLALPARGAAPEDAAFRDTVRPFLTANCAKCHGETQAKAGLRVDRLRPDEDVASWEKILDQLKTGEMPPRKEPRPKPAEVDAVRAWITAGLARAAEKARQAPGRAVLRRLNRAEYDNTIRDLFGLDCRPASRFPQDDSAHGFDNVGSALTVSPLLLEKYLQAAEIVTSRAIVGTRPAEFKKRWLGKDLAYGKYLKELEGAGRAIPDGGVVVFQSGPQANGGENLTAYQIPFSNPKHKTAVAGEYVFRMKASYVGFGCSEKLKGKI